CSLPSSDCGALPDPDPPPLESAGSAAPNLALVSDARACAQVRNQSLETFKQRWTTNFLNKRKLMHQKSLRSFLEPTINLQKPAFWIALKTSQQEK
ncbi:unnamed protein product, partial [Gulo gulo]